QPAAGRNPGLRLRDADVEEVPLGVVAAGDPGVAAAPQLERQVTPGVASRFARASDRVRTPPLFTVAGTVAGDEAARLVEPLAAAGAGDDHAVDDHRASRVPV